MKKGISVLLAVCLLLTLLGGCSGKNEEKSVPEGVSSGVSFSGGVSQASSGESAGETSEESGAQGEASEPESKGLSGGEVTLFTWEAMFPREVLDGFTEETGIEIHYMNFNQNEGMLALLAAADSAGGKYDLVLADDYILESVIDQGLAQKLDASRLKNYKSVNPIYQGQFYDPEDAYIVPYGANVQTILVNPDTVNGEIAGYADLWDASLQGKVGLSANYRVADGMALKVLGESFNTENVSVIETAGKKLLELAPNVGLLGELGTSISEALSSGNVSAAVLYTAQVSAAKKEDPSLEVVYPEEGLAFGLQGAFIPSQAPNADGAYQLLDYLLRPEVAAKCFEYTGSYSTNKDADSLISEEYRDFLTLPEGIGREDMELIRTLSDEAAAAHEKNWNAFKAACE